MDIETYDLFSRQTPYLGLARQDALSRAKIAVVGAGGLGSFVSEMLVRAGTGVVRIIDPDVVEKSNLHRTALFDRTDVGKAKAFVAQEKLSSINPASRVENRIESLNAYNAEDLLAGFGVVVDCTDNMEARYTINKFCIKNKIPWVYGAVLRDEGFSSTFAPSGRPCFACLYPEAPRKIEKASEAGVIAPAVATIASWQAMEVIKIATGIAEPNYSKLYRVRLKRPGFEILAIKAREDCEVCGKNILRRRCAGRAAARAGR